MTKTLTEQWREGTLEDGEYYVKDWDGKIDWFVAKNKILWRDNNNPMYASERIEVLAPVPSYDEYCNLVFKANMPKNPVGDTIMCYDTERERAVVERLQEQLKEAEKTISDQELVIKHQRKECYIHNQKTVDRKAHINELIEENKSLKEELKKKNIKLNELRQQRNEANKLILWCARLSWTGDPSEDIFDKYLAKWGVK